MVAAARTPMRLGRPGHARHPHYGSSLLRILVQANLHETWYHMEPKLGKKLQCSKLHLQRTGR
jgi:hypothetical protein